MTSKAGLALVSLLLLAAAWSATGPAPAQTLTPSEADRRACERSGGYWVTAVGYCKIGA
jgi:hypothetical protein